MDPNGMPDRSSAWVHVTPAEAGFADDIGARLDDAVCSGRTWNLHGIVIVRRGRLVLERYYDGEDYCWGRPLGHVTFGPETLHDLRSVTKSITSLLYGIALAQGRVPPPQSPLLAQFPEYPDLAADPKRSPITVGHVLSMTMGTDWNEQLPYTTPENSEIAMELAPDRYRFVLERRVVEPPGRNWIYSGGATALVGHMIARGTGRPLPEFARSVLFDPLGIGESVWTAGSDGIASAASGLRLAPRDLARIGQMIVQRGQWQGSEVVPARWLDAAFEKRTTCDPARDFGYHWYTGTAAVGAGARPERWVGAIGNGGQRLYVLPGIDLSVVFTAGNYDTPDQWKPPTIALREIILPALKPD
jgi:CubicO group peptidase (beta-lactamase class C family)